MPSKKFKINGIDGECEFSPIDMRDGLRISGYAARLNEGSVDDSADAMERLGSIALKYFKVNGEPVKDIAGLVSVAANEDNAMLLTVVTLKFMEAFNDFL